MKGMSNHKELAATGKISTPPRTGIRTNLASGGVVTPKMALPKAIKQPKGVPMSPLTLAKRNNGIVGMKKGGKC
jgi:hypothetical protein